MRHGIVGHEASKFTPETEAAARNIIRLILQPGDVMVSGGCHLGGIDIWAEEEARALGNSVVVCKPAKLQWSGQGGFQDRNIQIAKQSDVVHVIVVHELPATYRGMRFKLCYHCGSTDHVKSGGCWTAHHAVNRFGKQAQWHVIHADGTVSGHTGQQDVGAWQLR